MNTTTTFFVKALVEYAATKIGCFTLESLTVEAQNGFLSDINL